MHVQCMTLFRSIACHASGLGLGLGLGIAPAADADAGPSGERRPQLLGTLQLDTHEASDHLGSSARHAVRAARPRRDRGGMACRGYKTSSGAPRYAPNPHDPTPSPHQVPLAPPLTLPSTLPSTNSDGRSPQGVARGTWLGLGVGVRARGTWLGLGVGSLGLGAERGAPGEG